MYYDFIYRTLRSVSQHLRKRFRLPTECGKRFLDQFTPWNKSFPSLEIFSCYLKTHDSTVWLNDYSYSPSSPIKRLPTVPQIQLLMLTFYLFYNDIIHVVQPNNMSEFNVIDCLAKGLGCTYRGRTLLVRVKQYSYIGRRSQASQSVFFQGNARFQAGKIVLSITNELVNLKLIQITAWLEMHGGAAELKGAHRFLQGVRDFYRSHYLKITLYPWAAQNPCPSPLCLCK